ncbi:hypothetical protein CPB83DRAFT_727479, partial [Crepidotus variabilis]
FLSPASHILPVKTTDLLLRPHGFIISDNLYLRNGTLYAVAEDPSTWPELHFVLSKGLSSDLKVDLDPTEKEMRIITPSEAKVVLGETALAIDGMTFILYDIRSNVETVFIQHYYHWWGEIILGAMRIYSALTLLPNITLPLPEPKRFIIPNVGDHSWRDYAGVDGPMMRAAFPSSSISRGDYWDDLATLQRTFVFERAMVVSREAAHKHPLSSQWFKMISSTMSVKTPKHFWEPLRQRLVINTLSHLPLGPDQHFPSKPIESSNHELNHGAMRISDTWLEPLEEMAKRKRGIPLRKRQDGVLDASIPLIMVGVHGNGLTHQIWMPPSNQSTVIEIFYPKTYLHDYEMLARNMGHKHYAVWNDTTLTYPEGKWFPGVEGGIKDTFHGYSIPVHGPTVAEVVRKRL